MRPFLPAFLVFVLVLGVAPAIGHVRDFLFEAFPENSVRFLAAGFAAVAAALLLYGVVRIREHRWLRYGGLLLVVGLLWVQTVGLSTDHVRVDVVEKIHILEYGGLAFLVYRGFLRRRSGAGDLVLVLSTFFAVTIAGTIEEGVQWLVPQRTGEIRDVALNATAGLSGLLFSLCLRPPAGWTWRLDPSGRRRILAGAAVTLAALGLFFYAAHLGHEIEDPEIGRFRSYFTAGELAEISARRAEAWSVDPPTELATWAFEDYFLSEAAWHAEHRNTSLEAGLATHAWLANRVLEKYYSPFLDLESFRGSGRHRYSPEQRRGLEEGKTPHDPSTYVSPVGRERIHAISKPLYLAILGILVAALAVPASLRPRPHV